MPNVRANATQAVGRPGREADDMPRGLAARAARRWGSRVERGVRQHRWDSVCRAPRHGLMPVHSAWWAPGATLARRQASQGTLPRMALSCVDRVLAELLLSDARHIACTLELLAEARRPAMERGRLDKASPPGQAVLTSATDAAKCCLTFELTRPERTAGLPGRRTIANLRRPGKAAGRGGSRVERGVRRHFRHRLVAPGSPASLAAP